MTKIIYDNGYIKGKPEPDMFIQSAQIINKNSSECLVFEDSESGILVAKRAGISKIIIVDPPGEESKFCDDPDIDNVISNFTEFEKGNYF